MNITDLPAEVVILALQDAEHFFRLDSCGY